MHTRNDHVRCALAAVPCERLERRVLLDGGGFYDDGTLTVLGTEQGNEILVTYTDHGVAVWVDGQNQLFSQPVHTVAVDAREGNNTVVYRQFVIADIALSIVAGAGEDDIDVGFDLLRPGVPPSGGGDSTRSAGQMHMTAFIDTGPGSDSLDFLWNSTAAPGLNAFAQLTANGVALGPEQTHDVSVRFEHGDPDRPLITGSVYNARGDRDSGPDQRTLVLATSFTPANVDVDFQLIGGSGPDEVELWADHTGGRLHQSSVSINETLSFGANRTEVAIVSSARYMLVESDITAGDGNNDISLDLTHAVQHAGAGFATHLSQIRLGDGHNVVQTRETDFNFVSRHLEAGDGDNTVGAKVDSFTWKQAIAKQAILLGDGNSLIDVDVVGVSDVDLSLTAGDGNNTVRMECINNLKQIGIGLHLGDGDNLVLITADNRALDPQLFGLDPATMNVSILAGVGNNFNQVSSAGVGGLDILIANTGVDGPIKNATLTCRKAGGDQQEHLLQQLGFALEDGNATVQVHTVGYDDVALALDLGDGDHQTHLSFADSPRGRPSPSTGQTTISTTYRSGAGSDTIMIDGEANRPVDARFVLEPGDGHSTVGVSYVFADWSTSFAPDHYARIKVQFPWYVDALSVTFVDQLAAIPGQPAEFVVIAIGQQTQGTLEFVRRVGGAHNPPGSPPIFVPVRRFTMHDVIADELSLAMTDGQSGVAIQGKEISLKNKSTYHTVAIETLTLANEGWRVHLDGLEVSDFFSLDMDVVSPVANLAVSNVQAGEDSSCWIRVSHVGAAASLALRNLQIDGGFALTVQGPDAAFEMAMNHATVGRMDWTNFNDSDPGVTRSAPGQARYNQINLENVLVAGWLNTVLVFGDTDLVLATSAAAVGHWGMQIQDISDLNNPPAAAKDKYLQITLEDAIVTGYLNNHLNLGDRGGLASFIQDRVVIHPGASMDVRLNGGDGDDVILSLLRDIATAGDGSYSFAADGGAGDDFIAVLARDLDPGAQGMMAFEVLGGAGNDTLALALLAPAAPAGAIVGRINGGPGFNRCFATSNVIVDNCHEHLTAHDVLRGLRLTLAPITPLGIVSNKEYFDEWRAIL